VDQAYCERHHGNEPSFLFGPCFLYANEGFAVGWFGGAIVVPPLERCESRKSVVCSERGDTASNDRSHIGAAPG